MMFKTNESSSQQSFFLQGKFNVSLGKQLDLHILLEIRKIPRLP